MEFGGRACYRSWEPGLNPNVTRVRTDQKEYFANILRSAHGSVLEHANWSFALRNVSRVFTHELVRHRAGSAFSQESLRYVRLTDIGFRVPPALEPVREQVLSIVEQLEEFQVKAAEELGIDGEGVPVSRQEGGHLGAAPARADRALDRHLVDRQRAHLAPCDRDAYGRGRRGGATPGVRSNRAHHADRGARACSRTSRAKRMARGSRSTARFELADQSRGKRGKDAARVAC